MPAAVMPGENDCGGPGWRCGAVVPFRFPDQVSCQAAVGSGQTAGRRCPDRGLELTAAAALSS